MLKDIRIEFGEPIFIHYDNTSTINMLKSLVLHSKSKKISIKYHMLREREYVSTKEEITNIFTKPLPKEFFEYL